DDIQNIAVFPLAIPLLAGPGAISAVILLSSKASDAISYAKISGMILFVLALVYVAFLTAGHIDKVLGTTGRNVLTRLLGVLLSALAVQFVADGISAMAAA
ncbi:MAG: MarC family protein, partial [Cohaesibacteraceae bacterium]|nr:MarC family protein [Cohaesibacteraceae bacterium]